MRKFLISIFGFIYLNALNCSSVNDIKKYNGHYYTITSKKMTFLNAKQFAQANDGYLAIPNSSGENEFLKSLIPTPKYAWIGVYDPDYMTNYCVEGQDDCLYDDSRFVDIKGNALSYTNWAEYQPDNLVKGYDIVNGKEIVTPLGEHWVAISSLDGKWADFGNHADEYNNPIKHYALIEFDSMPDCYTPPSDVNDTYSGAKCDTQIWDKKTGTLEKGETYTCLEDKKGQYYCPSQLAPCGDNWDYKNSEVVKHIGVVKDYRNKIKYIKTERVTKYTGCSDVNAKGLSVLCKNSWRWSCSSENRNPDGSCGEFFCPNPKKVANNQLLCFGPNGEVCIRAGQVFDNPDDWVFDGACSDNDRCCYHKRNNHWSRKVFTPIRAGYRYTTTQTRVYYTCPSGYSNNGSNCVKSVNYSYYEYKCSGENYYDNSYQPINPGLSSCNKSDPNYSSDNTSYLSSSCNSPTPPPNNCKAKSYTCVPAPDRKCAYVDNKWQCSPFPCFGEGAGDYQVTNTDTPVGLNDKKNDGWNNDGSCSGTIYIFNGKDNRCRSDDTFFGLTGGGCCDKDKVFMGIVKCKEDEKLLAKKRDKKQCHYIGEYCSKELNLIFTKICIQHKQTYCCFNSLLARLINEQGRPQIKKGWGSAESPDCSGFTPEQFQKLDFSKLDLSEFYDQITQNVTQSFADNMNTYIQNSVTNQLENMTNQ